MRILLKHGADPNRNDDKHSSLPLYHAISKHHLAAANELIQHGANPYIQDRPLAPIYTVPKYREKISKMVNGRTAQLWGVFRGTLDYYVIEKIIKYYFEVDKNPETESDLLNYLRHKNNALSTSSQDDS